MPKNISDRLRERVATAHRDEQGMALDADVGLMDRALAIIDHAIEVSGEGGSSASDAIQDMLGVLQDESDPVQPWACECSACQERRRRLPA